MSSLVSIALAVSALAAPQPTLTAWDWGHATEAEAHLRSIAFPRDARTIADVLAAAGAAGVCVMADAELGGVPLADLGVSPGASCADAIDALDGAKRCLLHADYGILCLAARGGRGYASAHPPSSPAERPFARELRAILEALPREAQLDLARCLPVYPGSPGGGAFQDAYDDLRSIRPGEKRARMRAIRGTAEPRAGIVFAPPAVFWPIGEPERQGQVGLVGAPLWTTYRASCDLPPEELRAALAAPVAPELQMWWDADLPAPPPGPPADITARQVAVPELRRFGLPAFCQWLTRQGVPCSARVASPAGTEVLLAPTTYGLPALLELAAALFEVHLSWADGAAVFEEARAELPRFLLAQWYTAPEWAAIPFALEDVLAARRLNGGELTLEQRVHLRASQASADWLVPIHAQQVLPEDDEDWAGYEFRLLPQLVQMYHSGEWFCELDDPAAREWKCGGNMGIQTWPFT